MTLADARLDALRLLGDPPADRVIEQLATSGRLTQVNELLRHLQANHQPIPQELPVPVRDFLAATSSPPAWADPARLARAADLAAQHGLALALILCSGSLVDCYAARKGVKVLTFTHRLDQSAHRRVAETAQFVLMLFSRESFVRRGHAVPAIQKVRLLHAAIRCLIKQSGRWPRAELGEPICQEDLLGTLMAFTVVVWRGLRRLGIQLSPAECEDYLYLWRVTGELLGIMPEIIPTDVAEAEATCDAIARRHHGPSPEGVLMTRALLHLHQHLLPGRLFEGAMAAVIRLMVGEGIADWMEVPHTRWQHVADHLSVLGRHTAEPHSALVRHAIGVASRTLLFSNALMLGGFRRA
ncbi:MAG TPA: oxygenase MpaB family protein, partial [Limnochordia bacterium]|nr:oxygenase MpaB family protein [Limnochordia bacterium]